MKKYGIRSAMILMSLALAAGSALAQRAGQSATIRTGYVVGMQSVELNSEDVGKGVLIGGAVGAAATSSKKSSSRHWRNAAIGATVGGAIGASNRAMGRQYSVRTNDGTIIQIVTEQTEIRVDDCVYVEEAGGRANIRRAPQTACEPSSQAVMNDPVIQEELQEEAAECAAAKDALLAAETDEEIDRAVRKIKILCYN
jgi:outer membrane lipoprotein SlyB